MISLLLAAAATAAPIADLPAFLTGTVRKYDNVFWHRALLSFFSPKYKDFFYNMNIWKNIK